MTQDTPNPQPSLREQLISGELYRLASLVGTDAKTPFTNLVDYIEQVVTELIATAKPEKREYGPNDLPEVVEQIKTEHRVIDDYEAALLHKLEGKG